MGVRDHRTKAQQKRYGFFKATKPGIAKLQRMALFGGLCAYCARRVREGEMTCDHVVPLARNGTNDPNNLVAACFECNNEKAEQKLDEWVYTRWLEGRALRVHALIVPFIEADNPAWRGSRWLAESKREP